ncbi:MAG: alpha-L-rhamnosidase [Kiritimatiellae bacterium]|nr:alpha-L-rhamnosidase [Kiritimatiellia bacterium]MDD5522920.1 alpha-L-rhamnosidase [Kiritimatiellia bacterium]
MRRKDAVVYCGIFILLFCVEGIYVKSEPAIDLQGRNTVDPRVRQYVVPAKIVWSSSNDAVKNSEVLLQKRSGQTTLEATNPCVLDNSKGPAGILLDFGRELHGGVQIMAWNTKNRKPVHLRVRFGESVSETMSELGGSKNAVNDHAIRDQTCLVPWLGTHEIGNTGFRFVRIDLADGNSMVQLKSVRAIFIYRDLEYKGSFKCSDEKLNRIWQTGAYTVHLNMQDYLWDGIKRDRLVWIGDMHPETMTIYSVFGCNEIIPASLDLIRDETPLPKWMNGISSYSMWWVLIQHSWYIQSGDLEYLKKQQVYLTGLLEQLIKHIDQDNKETLTGMRFMDWPSASNKEAVHAGLQSLMIFTMVAGGDLCSILGNETTMKKCDEAVERLRKHIPVHGNSKQAAALIALSGLGNPVKLNKEVMAVDGPKRMSTFYGYYVLQARAMAGDYQGCLDVIRQYWGAMLDVGATTFWEDFDLEWTVNAGRIDEIVPEGKKDIHGDYGNYCYKGFRHSLCHGWASGPTAWLSEYVLGVKVLKPGCKVVRIVPHLGDLQWAEGTYPTSCGIIKVKHVKKPDGTIESTIDAPQGVEIVRR